MNHPYCFILIYIYVIYIKITEMNNIKQTDLQSFGELEKFMYGGHDAFSYFRREIKKCLPFVQHTHEITKHNGTSNFGFQWSLVIDKAQGDYLENIWVLCELPEVKLLSGNIYGENGVLRWTKNLFHNLIEECTLTFNDMVVSKLDNYSLDFISEFLYGSKNSDNYKSAIGNRKCLSSPNSELPRAKLFLPLPLFFCKDSGNAIPLISLPHTEIKINFKFRPWEQLLILENKSSVGTTWPIHPEIGRDIGVEPLCSLKTYGTFVTVTDEERSKTTISNLSYLIEQIQTSPRQMIGNTDTTATIDLLFKQSVKTLYFAVRNSTFKNVWSNYCMDSPEFIGGILKETSGKEIIDTASILYNNKERVCNLPAEFFSYINPWYNSTNCPVLKGLYCYNFTIDANSSDPSGGVSLSRIDNPSLKITLNVESGSKNLYEFVVVAMSNNILQISEGVGKFPCI
nr:MAG: major capsid protein [Diabrotica toursvirus 3a]